MATRSARRALTALLVGAGALLLQQWSIDYQIDLLGYNASGSLVHLHTGLLLALAMSYLDRIYLRTAFVFVFLGRLWHAWGQGYGLAILILTMVLYALMYAWTVWSAQRMGWPRPAAEQQIRRGDLARFALYGLLLYPLGWAVLDYAMTLRIPVWEPAFALNDAVQTLFAQHFGVSVVTLPLLLLLGEHFGARRRFESDSMVLAVLLLGAAANLLASFTLHGPGSGPHDPLASILSYRFVLIAILAWCALRLRPNIVVPILMSVQMLLLFSLAESAPRMDELAGVLKLLKAAFELSVLQLLIVLLLVMRRDGESALANLREESQHEAITGLRNLNGLFSDASRMKPPPQEIAYLALANLDRLAGGFGLRVQEALMQETAKHLSDEVETYYVGTGQFALIWKGTATPKAWDAVLHRLEQYSFRYAGESLRLTPYLGVSALEGTAQERIEAALDAASTAAQDAAMHGDMHPVRAQPALLGDASSANRDASAIASLALSHLRARELELFFQPIRRIGEPPDQPIRYGEVLCRLGVGGKLLMPNSFIRELEVRGRSVELDLAVINCLFAWLRKHTGGNLPRLGINLTGRSVTSDSFRQTLLKLIDQAPVPPASLCFEITETEAIARFSDARRLLEDLRRRGCGIALDDFGIGMQSFERLRELPFDIVKIDGSFVRGITARARDYELVRASVAVAHACGADTTAEYVENREIAKCLEELGVSWGQGDYFGVAAPIDEVLKTNAGV